MKLPWSTTETWLRGVTILDFSSLLPCPFAAQLLSDLGARVIKIESPTRPDPAREFGHEYDEVNRGKELLLLDLKNPADRAKAHELVKTAQGAIEGYRPDVKKRLGIDYETLRALNPAIVLCSASGYKADGPLASRAGHDLNFVARSGILDLTRDREGRVVMPGVPLADIAVAYTAALRMLAALQHAARTGEGCHVEVSIEESLIDIQRPFLKGHIETLRSGGVVHAGETLVTGRFPCYEVYALDGGTLAVGALEAKFWQLFCESLGRPDLVAGQFATGADGARVKAEVAKALGAKPFAHWVRTYQHVDCCVEAVLTVNDVAHAVEGGL